MSIPKNIQIPRIAGELRGRHEGRLIDPTRRTDELDCIARSNSPNGRVGRLARSNSPNGRVGRWVFRSPGSVVRGLVRKASTKSHHDRSVPNGCSSQYDNIAPKVEFVEHSIDPEEANAYWVARGNLKPPRPGTWHPHPFHVDPVEGCLSRSCPNGLAAIRSFCRVPESVEFHLPVAGEVAESPPDGYFTCFEAYLMQFHLWFPLQEFIPDLPVEEGEESSMDGFVPHEAPAERRGSRTHKDKHIAVDDDGSDEECFPEDILGDYLNCGVSIDLDELLGSDVPVAEGGSGKGPEFTKASRMVNGGLLMMNRALNASSQEARMAQFRAEMAGKEIALLGDELERSRRCEGELTAKEIRRAYRRGKKEMDEVMKNRRAQFSCEFGKFKESYQALGAYRECRSTVGGLYFTQAPDYSFAAENVTQTRRMKERDRDFALPQIEERIWKQWEPILIFPDTVEAETGAPDDTGEVNQPSVPLNVNDYSVGGIDDRVL
ncbi:hypothetical protein F2Q70_00017406 [Brassica cretica]|uniref:Uncharacterized protein n=1 Tax=Brassica cretica TaxID=69181 RepID=A0A8S9I6H7_BRACR|nr:hypothetical protein F2Q70_00017406 [Brassica cretica]